MNLQEIHQTIMERLPEGGMSAGGVLLCLIAWKLCRGTTRSILIFIALGLFVGVVLLCLYRSPRRQHRAEIVPAGNLHGWQLSDQAFTIGEIQLGHVAKKCHNPLCGYVPQAGTYSSTDNNYGSVPGTVVGGWRKVGMRLYSNVTAA